MELLETEFEGLIVIRPNLYSDERGTFHESFNDIQYSHVLGKNIKFVQDNVSTSKKNVIRGLHFQNPPHEQIKLVQVLSGRVIDVVVDIRLKSKTFGQHFTIDLNGDDMTQLLIPAGFAHGFCTISEKAVFAYKCSNFYNQKSEGSLLWNDNTLNIPWPIKNPIISEKDRNASRFNNFKSAF